VQLSRFSDGTPDESAILNFQHSLERHHRARLLFDPSMPGVVFFSRPIVEASLISASGATKHNEGKRDEAMH